ncbi:hypothetical protein BX600DRAFT_527913 [Xylariales sp. PMI_506]|nr:hypothetical protein BX600DRAFT_527913 [Xylariales sp. PMI_506]
MPPRQPALTFSNGRWLLRGKEWPPRTNLRACIAKLKAERSIAEDCKLDAPVTPRRDYHSPEPVTPRTYDRAFAPRLPSQEAQCSPTPSVTFGNVCRTPPVCDQSFADTPPPWDRSSSSIRTSSPTHTSVDTCFGDSAISYSAASKPSLSSSDASSHFSWEIIQDPLWSKARVKMYQEDEEFRQRYSKFWKDNDNQSDSVESDLPSIDPYLLYSVPEDSVSPTTFVESPSISSSLSSPPPISGSDGSWTFMEKPPNVPAGYFNRDLESKWRYHLTLAAADCKAATPTKAKPSLPSRSPTAMPSSVLSPAPTSASDGSWTFMEKPPNVPAGYFNRDLESKWRYHLTLAATDCKVASRTNEDAQNLQDFGQLSPIVEGQNGDSLSSSYFSDASSIDSEPSWVKVDDKIWNPMETNIFCRAIAQRWVAWTEDERLSKVTNAQNSSSCIRAAAPDVSATQDEEALVASNLKTVVKKHVRRYSACEIPRAVNISTALSTSQPRATSWTTKACAAAAAAVTAALGLAYTAYSWFS